jgi:hypothetical protein
MSLDVYLKTGPKRSKAGSGIFVREGGETKEISRKEWDEKFPGREPLVCRTDEETDEVYSRNITHNMNRMAEEAGLYEPLWCPERLKITKAAQLIEPLKKGLALLKSDPVRFKKFNPKNGWGNYESLVDFVECYLDACVKYPEAEVEASR